MSYNSFGNLFRFTSYGESHGPAIGCIVDGVPPNISLNEKDIQKLLDRRKPGQSKFVSQRKESDKVEILSGVFENKTTGHPIALNIKNEDRRSKDYNEIANKFRPSHADITYHEKYKIRDYRGGGRSSARETAMRVAAGAIARLILGPKIIITGAVIQLGKKKINKKRWDDSFIKKNNLFCPDPKAIQDWENYLTKIRKSGSSCGALIEVRVKGMPVGLGEPIYGKLDAEIASALMGINAVKGVEIGAGFNVVSMLGEQNSDEMVVNKNGDLNFLSNNAGGVLGGISSGQDLIVRIAIKPTSSIRKNRNTVDKDGRGTEISTKGRHDPCVGIRATPIGEAMIAIVLMDHALRDRGQNKR